MSSKIFEDAINRIPAETMANIRLSVEIVERIYQLMTIKNMN